MASALFASACAYAAYRWFAMRSGPPMLGAETAAAGLLAYFLIVRALSAVQPAAARLPVPIFDVREVEPFDDAAPRISEPVDPAGEPEDALLLDDILADLAPNSRVVRLFDPAAMPTAGELQSRIDRHLEGSTAHTADAAQALNDALAELRRSLG